MAKISLNLMSSITVGTVGKDFVLNVLPRNTLFLKRDGRKKLEFVTIVSTNVSLIKLLVNYY